MVNFLKSLELQGFKSFAEKLTLEFPARVTAIVGPNGSGKSNVIDALRWVLGEREAKQLRGGSLENLIFAGTPKRSAQGFARVALHFDNAKKLFPLESPEVVISRRVDRSGTSEFAWNEMDVRLKELLPIFARAKLGARGLNMIGQGESDIFVRSNPEERRLMIEEILGLREFRIKKNQAERRLDSSEINMEKVAAMLEELEPHLRMLRRQKNRFEKRSEIEVELRDLENKYFGKALHVLKKEEIALETPINETGDLKKKKNEEVLRLTKDVQALNTKSEAAPQAKALREKITAKIIEKSGLERELTKLETKREFMRERPQSAHTPNEFSGLLEELHKEIGAWLVLNDIETLRLILKHWLERIQTFLGKDKEKGVFGAEEEEEKIRKIVVELEVEIKALRSEEEELSDLQESLNKEFRVRIEELETQKSALRVLEHKLEQLGFEKEKIKLRLGELQREWHTIGRLAHELGSLPTFTGELDLPESERRMLRLRGELAAIGDIDPNLIKEAQEKEERYIFLERELEDLKKASVDLKHLIKELDAKIHDDFKKSFSRVNEEFNKHFQLMFGGGRAKMKIVEPETKRTEAELVEAAEAEGGSPELVEGKDEQKTKMAGVEIELTLPKKKIHDLNMLSGGEKSLVSLAALFALIAVSPPPFLVLDEIDAPLDEENARRFSELIKSFSHRTQFIIVTHNRSTMEAADVLYGVTMEDDGVSKVLSLKLEETEAVA